MVIGKSRMSDLEVMENQLGATPTPPVVLRPPQQGESWVGESWEPATSCSVKQLTKTPLFIGVAATAGFLLLVVIVLLMLMRRRR